MSLKKEITQWLRLSEDKIDVPQPAFIKMRDRQSWSFPVAFDDSVQLEQSMYLLFLRAWSDEIESRSYEEWQSLTGDPVYTAVIGEQITRFRLFSNCSDSFQENINAFWRHVKGKTVHAVGRNIYNSEAIYKYYTLIFYVEELPNGRTV